MFVNELIFVHRREEMRFRMLLLLTFAFENEIYVVSIKYIEYYIQKNTFIESIFG